MSQQNEFHTSAKDDRRINLNEEYEVLYWAQKFGVTPEQLRQIVRSTGPSLKEVRRKLWR